MSTNTYFPPSTEQTDTWQENTMIYQQVFSCVPNDHIHSRCGMQDPSSSFHPFQSKYCARLSLKRYQTLAGTNFAKVLLIGRRKLATQPSTWVLP